MNNKLLILSILLGVLFSCQSNSVNKSEPTAATEATVALSLDAIAANDRVKTGNLETKVINHTIEATGQIDLPPTERASIHSSSEGQLVFLKYLPGDFVKKGTRLASISNPKLVEKQRLFLETKVNYEFAKKDFTRKEKLKIGNAVSDKTFDESQKEYLLLKASYEGLKTELVMTGIDIDKLENQNKFQTTVSVYAPQSGIINEVLVNKGQMIQPTTHLMSLVSKDNLHLELNVLSKDISRIETGQNVLFLLPNHLDTFQATITKINPTITGNEATLKVHCDINQKNKSIFTPGTYVNAIINSGSTKAFGLSKSAVIIEGDQYFGYQVVDGTLQKTELKNVKQIGDFIHFEYSNTNSKWVTKGAYYLY